MNCTFIEKKWENKNLKSWQCAMIRYRVFKTLKTI
jgi:hypothetical protein